MTFGQTVKQTVPEIEKYAKNIDKLISQNKLKAVSNQWWYPSCGGNVKGFYLNNDLVFIESKIQVELGANYYKQLYYFKDNNLIKVIRVEYHSDWEKYDLMYPPEKFDEFDPTKMTYNDTTYVILFAEQTIYKKIAYTKLIDDKINQTKADRLVNCGQEIKLELNEIIEKIDSLKFVKEMPYICESGICGDELYWKTVKMGRYNIELLIDKLDDTTATTANVVLFGGYYTVADIAYCTLNEIIHNIPTFDLLGVQFDKEGCGYCSYWKHLNKSISNRQKFKEAVKNWYHKNKDNLVWVENNNFSTCDCSGKHPNSGHYELKTNSK